MAVRATGVTKFAPPAGSEKAVIVDSIRSIAQELRTAGRQVEETHGITRAQLDVLRALQSGPAYSINELAERTFTHQSSVSVVVARLAEAAFVSRAPFRKDARRQAIALTPAGRAALRRAGGTAEDRLVAALKGMNRGELRGLAGFLEKLSSKLGERAE